jgi:hypothetical protein
MNCFIRMEEGPELNVAQIVSIAGPVRKGCCSTRFLVVNGWEG